MHFCLVPKTYFDPRVRGCLRDSARAKVKPRVKARISVNARARVQPRATVLGLGI